MDYQTDSPTFLHQQDADSTHPNTNSFSGFARHVVCTDGVHLIRFFNFRLAALNRIRRFDIVIRIFNLPVFANFWFALPYYNFYFWVAVTEYKKCPIVMAIILFVWSVIGFMAAFQFGILEDTG